MDFSVIYFGQIQSIMMREFVIVNIEIMMLEVVHIFTETKQLESKFCYE